LVPSGDHDLGVGVTRPILDAVERPDGDLQSVLSVLYFSARRSSRPIRLTRRHRFAMRRIEGIHHGDLVVDDDVLVVGAVTGNIRIEGSGHLRLEGTTSGHVLIHANGAATIQGEVYGSVLNSGLLIVAGEVHGRLIESGDSITSIGRGASIAGARRR
jgi:hypothetical protein